MAPGKTGVRAGRKSASVRSNHIHGTFFHRLMHWSEHGLQATAGVMLYIMGTIRGSTAMAMRLSTFQKGAVGSGWSRSCWPVVVLSRTLRVLELLAESWGSNFSHPLITYSSPNS